MGTVAPFSSMAAAVDHVLDTLPGDIVLGIPLGIGKPNPFVNALYDRIKANPARRLRIVTALSLEKPVGHSDLERHFLEPLVERVFGDYPDLHYVKDSRAGALPANIEVREFFMKTGDYLGNPAAQQGYISTNYTFVARDMAVQGMNVIAQAVAAQGEGDTLQLSLSSNPDVTIEVVENLRAAGQPVIAVGVINRRMPFMPNGAEVAPGFFDLLVTDPAGTHQLFGPPNNKVSPADYAIGLHASSLVADGGTLQIGIGSLGDAIAQALIVRDRHGDEYRRILQSLAGPDLGGRETGRFDEGLYGCSEMFVNGFLRLIEAGIVRREVFADTVLQQLINDGRIGITVTPGTLQALLDAGRIRSPLAAEDLAFLQHYRRAAARGAPARRTAVDRRP
jgi:acyl-CoA hydrolase